MSLASVSYVVDRFWDRTRTKMKMITAMTIKSNPQITPVAIEEQKKENNRGNFLDPALAIYISKF